MLLLSRFKIYGHSMEPTVLDGETVFASSIPYLFSKPKVGDIVLVKYSQLRHSGKQSDSRIPKGNKRFWTSQNDEGDNKYLMKRIAKICQGKYYVIGDNEKDSMDSRRFGWIGKKEIVGKVVYKISNS